MYVSTTNQYINGEWKAAGEEVDLTGYNSFRISRLLQNGDVAVGGGGGGDYETKPVLITAPNNAKYELTVADDGTLSTVEAAFGPAFVRDSGRIGSTGANTLTITGLEVKAGDLLIAFVTGAQVPTITGWEHTVVNNARDYHIFTKIAVADDVGADIVLTMSFFSGCMIAAFSISAAQEISAITELQAENNFELTGSYVFPAYQTTVENSLTLAVFYADSGFGSSTFDQGGDYTQELTFNFGNGSGVALLVGSFVGPELTLIGTQDISMSSTLSADLTSLVIEIASKPALEE